MPSFEPLTPERRRAQTREYLLRAAAQVFAERGFHGASLDEVAAVAGFTKGAVYSNFASKDDLFVALLESRYDEEIRALRAALAEPADGPAAHLGDFADLLRDQFAATDDSWGVLYQEFCVYALRNPAARTKLARFQHDDVVTVAAIIAGERERHGLAGGETPEQAARIVIALMRGLSAMRLIEPDEVDRSLLEATLAFVARAMT